jgi:hypothetical protein
MTPLGTHVTYASHLRLEHELDDSSSSRIDDVLFTTGSRSSTLVKELSSARPHSPQLSAYLGTFRHGHTDELGVSCILYKMEDLHRSAYFHPVVERVYPVHR